MLTLLQGNHGAWATKYVHNTHIEYTYTHYIYTIIRDTSMGKTAGKAVETRSGGGRGAGRPAASATPAPKPAGPTAGALRTVRPGSM